MPHAEAQIIVIGGTSEIGLAIAGAAVKPGGRVTVYDSQDDRVDRAINGIGPPVEDFAAAAVLAMANGYLAGVVIDIAGG